MINKIVDSASKAVSDILDGATIMVGGFGDAGSPTELLEALAARRTRHLKIISNNAGNGDAGLARLFAQGQVEKITCSFPLTADPHAFKEAFERGGLEFELVPQGTLAERIRAGGAGLGGVITPTGVGTVFSEGKKTITLDSKEYLIESPLKADFALLKAWKADRWGNLIYRHAARNFNFVMATSASITIAQTKIIEPEGLSPDDVQTPSIFVDRVVQVDP